MNLQDIISGCKRRDLKAEKELYYLFAKKVFALAKKYTTETQEAEDLMQECFIRVFSQLHRFEEDKGKFEAWMYRVSVNTILQSIRAKKTSIQTIAIDHVAEPGDEDEEYMEVSGEFLEEALKELPHGYQEVFKLFVVQQWTHRQIAEHLHITEGTSRSQLTKAKKYLRQIIQAKPNRIYERK